MDSTKPPADQNAPDSKLVAAGQAALAAGDWAAARSAFEKSLSSDESAAAREGLGEALWWLDEVDAGLVQSQRAYTLYRKAGEPCRAARVAIWLARHHIGAHGNVAVGNGWMRRAEGLIEQAGDCPERGWLEQMRSKMAPDTAAAAEHSRAAVEIARRHGDANLEVWALSEHGRALVSLGAFDEGMALLDEAVAAATAGEAHNLLVVGDTCCNMISACDRAADFERALQWCEVIDNFIRRHHCMPMYHFCRVIYGGVLIATGRWNEAEAELEHAARAVARGHPAQTVHSLSRLSLLRVRQGRLEEAGALLSEFENHRAATEALAALALARGEPRLAIAAIERRLGHDPANGSRPPDDLLAVPLLRLLAEAHWELGQLDAADAAAERLEQLASRSKRPSIEAAARFAAACIDRRRSPASPPRKRSRAGATPPPPEPRPVASPASRLGEACAQFSELGMPFDAALARLECAQALAPTDPAVAAEDARAAQECFERLGARPYADRAAALLRELGQGSRPGPRLATPLSRREQEVLELVSRGLSNADIGQRLFISPKTVEHHVGRILSKLGVRTRAELIALTLRPAKPSSGRK